MIKKIALLSLTLLTTLNLFAQLVSNETELNSAIQNATAGSTIILANGTWDDVFIDVNGKNGTSTNPITIEGETPGLVLMTGNSRVYMEGSYLTVKGLVFQDPANLVVSGSNIEPVIELKECDHCKILNNKIDSYNGTEAQKELTFKWILADGQFNEIAYNSFTGKYGIGSIINDNRNSSDPDYLTIHHNYFADRTPINGFNEDNDQDAIRIGNSSTSLDDSFTEVYDNYFFNFVGEIEVISNKSGENKYYNNTFRDYSGSLTLRHGDNCEVYGNFFFGESNYSSAGIRVIGEGHRVYNNYIQDMNSRKLNSDGSTSGSNATGGINISNGRPNTALNGYYQVRDAYIVNNTLVNCDLGIRVGTNVGSDLSLAPDNVVIANNILLNSSDMALEIDTTPINGSIMANNITQNGSWDLTNNSDNNITVTQNLLSADTETYILGASSDAIDYGNSTHAPFIVDDVFSGARDASIDAGAEEFGGNKVRTPFTSDDVGETIGFGAVIFSEPFVAIAENTLEFSIGASSKEFIVSSNTNWSLSENLAWISLDKTSGSGNDIITLTVTENTTGALRTATVTITDTEGNNLTDALTVNQTIDTFDPADEEEIIADEVTAVGTQVNGDGSITNGPENTVDNDVTTRWSASSTDGSAYITYDLGCIHALTRISIFFHKSTIRTTKISIGTSVDGVNYTDSYTQVDSELLTSEAYEDFDLNLIEAQYVRIYGFGNSEDSPWNSIEEVKVFGDINCQPALSTEDNLLAKEVRLYPIPVTNGTLNLSTSNKTLGIIDIYDITGKKVLTKDAARKFSAEIDTSSLTSGVYILSVEGLGTAKVIIQ